MGRIFRGWCSRFRKKREPVQTDQSPLKVPTHLGIIMDGNGRWAKQRGLPRRIGHRAGAEALHDIVEASGRLGVRYLTVYAFSTENWKRPSDEIAALMTLFSEFFHKYDKSLAKNDVRVRFLGEKEGLPDDVIATWDEAERGSLNRGGMQLIVAFNYGGQNELLHALKEITALVSKGDLTQDDIQLGLVSDYLYLPDVPPADLIIRSSGEMRLSNFMIWQAAYAEFWVSDVLWPDFKPGDLEEAFRAYGYRDRRFGAVGTDKEA